MEIRHLKLIKSIVEEGSITNAIKKLHLTQSALSHQLKEAEYQLGTKIFTRANKKLTLTQVGEKIYQTAKEVLDKLSDTEKEIKELISGERGEIKISMECYSGYHWLPNVLSKYQAIYPNIDLKIITEATDQPLKNLLLGSLDLAIVSDLTNDKGIKYLPLFNDELVVIVSENHHWANKKFIIPEDFISEHLFIHSLPIEKVSIYNLFLKKANVRPKKITPIPLTEASIAMVKSNMGVMSISKWNLQPYIEHDKTIKAIKIGKKGLERKFHIAIMNTRSYPDYFNHFLSFLETELN